MLSDKVSRILKSRGLSTQQLLAMTEKEAWDFVYRTATSKQERRIEICFTGYADDEKAELIEVASRANMKVVTGITKNLSILCEGENPGPTKHAKAIEQQVHIMNRSQFEHFLSTGELPLLLTT